jgi:predicted DNA-binding transcriptional regulator AlpA
VHSKSLSIPHREVVSTAPRDRLLTRRQAAELLGVSILWLYMAGLNPKLKFPHAIKIGDPANPRTPVRFLESELLAWIEERRALTTAAAAK